MFFAIFASFTILQFSLFTIIIFTIIIFTTVISQFPLHIFTFAYNSLTILTPCSPKLLCLFTLLVHPVHPLSAILSILSFQHLSLSRILVPRLPKHLVRELVENKIPANLAHFVQIFVLNLRQKL